MLLYFMKIISNILRNQIPKDEKSLKIKHDLEKLNLFETIHKKLSERLSEKEEKNKEKEYSLNIILDKLEDVKGVLPFIYIPNSKERKYKKWEHSYKIRYNLIKNCENTKKIKDYTPSTSIIAEQAKNLFIEVNYKPTDYNVVIQIFNEREALLSNKYDKLDPSTKKEWEKIATKLFW